MHNTQYALHKKVWKRNILWLTRYSINEFEKDALQIIWVEVYWFTKKFCLVHKIWLVQTTANFYSILYTSQ